MKTLELIKTDRELDGISRNLSFLAINPLNEEEEKRKFFASSVYNPQLRYEPLSASLVIQEQHLQKMRIGKNVLGRILEQKRKEYLVRISLLRERGMPSFTEWSLKVYGQPNNRLIKEARKYLHYNTDTEKNTLTTDQIIRLFRHALASYGFNWQVKEKEMTANAAVSIHDRTLYIRKKAQFSKMFLKRLVVHEIGTHILRNENGRKQPYKVFARGLPGYLPTEEGLALINEELNGCQNNALLKVYAGRVIAIDKALTSSFRETYNMLLEYFPPDMAWRMTLRSKRGLQDTSLPGGCTKDYVYLKGYMDIKDYILEGGDLSKLYYGKIGLQHVDELQNIPWLVHPEYLPVVRYFEYFLKQLSSMLNLKSIIRPLTVKS